MVGNYRCVSAPNSVIQNKVLQLIVKAFWFAANIQINGNLEIPKISIFIKQVLATICKTADQEMGVQGFQGQGLGFIIY